MPANITKGQPYSDTIEMQTSYACNLWVIERADGVVERFTNWDENLDVKGVEVYGLFLASGGISQDAASKESGLRSQTTSAVGVLDGLDDELIAGGVYSNARITEFVVDARWPHSKGPEKNEWTVVQVEWSSDHWRFDLEGPGRHLKEVHGPPFTRNCPFKLGDQDCGLNLPGLTYGLSTPLTVTSVNPSWPRQAFKVALQTGTNALNGGRDTFEFGNVKFVTTANKNIGMSYEILTYDKAGLVWPQSGEFALYQETVVDISVGDRVVIEEGCDGELSTCISLNNWGRFGGNRFIPGAQKARQSAAINWQR